MKRKKVLITLLLCFLIGNKFCEGKRNDLGDCLQNPLFENALN